MKFLGSFFLSVSLITSAQNAYADDKPDVSQNKKDEKGIWSFSAENDFVFNKDNNYTAGTRISYVSPETTSDWVERTADYLPLLDPDGNKRWGLAVGQSLYTPNSVKFPGPPPLDQRPYAGWLYGTGTLISDTTKTLDTFQLTLGMVGPAALGGQTQNSVHNLLGGNTPAQGWAYQIRDEPGVIVSYDRKWRGVYETNLFGQEFDVTPSAGANLGNIDTDASVGLMFRFGQDLTSDYGPPLIKQSVSGSDFFVPHKDFSWYVFGGVEGEAVARNIFLDGNTFVDSRSVDKEPGIGDIQTGIVLTFGDTRVAFTLVDESRNYKGETQAEAYGSLTISMKL